MKYVRFVSKRGTVAVFAASLRDARHTAHIPGADRHSTRHEVAAATAKRMNRILRPRPLELASRHDSAIDRAADIASAARLPRSAGADRRRQRLPRRRRPQHRRRRPALERRGALLHADGLRRGPRRRARGAATPLRGGRSRRRFEMDHRFAESERRKRVAIMVSREDHCLSDLLWRWRSGELGGRDRRRDLQPPRPRGAGRHRSACPSTTSRSSRRARGAERRVLELLGGVDLLVLARYMQILSRRVPRRARARRRSTSTTASCPPSSAPTHTSAPTSAG